MKVLFVLEYPKKNYYTEDGTLAFSATKTGKDLYKRVTSPNSLGLDFKDVGVTFAYGEMPPVTPSGKVKPISKSSGKEQFIKLHNLIVEKKPELVVSLGGTSILGLTGKKGINTVRGTLLELTYTHSETEEEYQVPIIATLGLDSIYAKPSNGKLIDTDFQIIKRYLEGGKKAFQATTGDYVWVNEYDKVIKVFDYLIWHKGTVKNHPEVVALDFETNTLEYWRKGAEQILFTASWEEGQGIAIPLHYSYDNVWTPEQIKHIHELINELIMSDTLKVWANGKFDIVFTKYIHGLPYANNNIDIQTMHYLLVSEEAKVSRSLKVLAYEYTTMGGYEKPLESFKDNYHIKAYDKWAKEMTDKGIKFKKSDFPKQINEVDGSDFSYDWIPKDVLEPYAAGDTDATLRIYNSLKALIKGNEKWQHLIYDFYPKLTDALTDAEKNGFKLDYEKVELNKQVYTKERERIVEELYKQVPAVKELEQYKLEQLEEYLVQRALPPKERDEKIVKRTQKYYSANPDKQAELLKFNPSPNAGDSKIIMFDILGYKMPLESTFYTDTFIDSLPDGMRCFTKNPELVAKKLTPSGYKLDTKEALPYIIKEYDEPFAKLLTQYSKVDKLLGSFINKFPKVADDNGFLHTKFNTQGTVTSRLSSSGAYNAQQIPRRTSDITSFQYEYGIKAMFKSRFDNGVIINVDFKSLEVYISALLSGDKGLIQALLDGKDVHKDTASKAFGIEYEDVNKEQRSSAKAVIFGAIYGETALGMAQKEGWEVKYAEGVLNKVMATKPQLADKIEITHQQVKQNKYVETFSGFRRRLPEVDSQEKSVANRTLRQSFNAIVQGSGAYCTNNALIILTSLFRKYNLKSKIVLTVHDSIVVDCHPDEVPIATKLMKISMEYLPLPQLICDIPSDGSLSIPEKYIQKDGKHYRFPLTGEIEMGANYNDDVDYDEEEAKQFKNIKVYCQYKYLEVKLSEKADYYSKRVKNDLEPDGQGLSPEQVEEIQKQLDLIKPKFLK